jgi:Icc-related predicted phosphoesterase
MSEHVGAPFLRLAVITDLHYTIDTTSPGSAVRIQSAANTGLDPMDALISFVADNKVEADILVCGGDITNRANQTAFTTGWNKLKQLRSSLNAKELISTTGNHEVLSRPPDEPHLPGDSIHTHDPIGWLQEIDDYPAAFGGDTDRRWIYWGRGYEIVDADLATIVVLNSCHYHLTMQPLEFERGKIGSVLLKDLKRQLVKRKHAKKLQILLLHHHPVQHPDHDVEGQIDMFNGHKLIEALIETHSDWLVIHGHKHEPRLIRAQGAVWQPIIFSAGSFGARLNGTLATKTKNQFYVVNIRGVTDELGDLRMCATIESYYWSGTEWRTVSEIEQGLPNGCGFGPNINLSQLAVDIKRILLSADGYSTWDELALALPNLKRLTPDEIRVLKMDLRDKLDIKLGGESRLWFPTELST